MVVSDKSALLNITGEISNITRETAEEYIKSAEQGCAKAQNQLGLMYLHGVWLREDREKAKECFRKAAEQGLADGQFNYAAMIIREPFYDVGSKQDTESELIKQYDESVEWLLKAAEQGHVRAESRLGDIYYVFYYGMGEDPIDEHAVAKALKCYRKAAEHGDVDAQHGVWKMFRDSRKKNKNIAIDYQEAFCWLQKAVEENKYWHCAYSLALEYYFGNAHIRDYQKAFQWFIRVVELGEDEFISLIVAKMLYYGNHVGQNYQEALKWFVKNRYRCGVYVGNMYYYGEGVESDKNKALEWYRETLEYEECAVVPYEYFELCNETVAHKKYVNPELALHAAQQGDLDAQFELGRLYYHGIGIVKNIDEGVIWFKKAAERGYAPAMFCLGMAYLLHIKTDFLFDRPEDLYHMYNDYENAGKCFYMAAEQGLAPAQYNLGVLIEHGEEGYGTTEEWMSKAAEQGLAEAQCYLGRIYYDKGHYREALKWFNKAAKQDSRLAMYYLGKSFYIGNGVGCDYLAAASWYKKASERNSIRAQFELGSMYYEGTGVKQDFSEAVKWLREPATNFYQAMLYMGQMYYSGSGVKRDYCEALKWLDRELSFWRNCFLLGLMFYKGQGTPQDYNKAYKYFLWGTDNNANAHHRCQYYLGVIFYKGKGKIKDYEEALKWFREAAGEEHVGSQYYLGIMFYKGEGCEQDYKESTKWFSKAAEAGHAGAQYYLGKMYADGLADSSLCQ